MRGLHRRLIARLFAGFVLLSLLIGGALIYFELEAVDERVVALANAATAGFLHDNRDALLHPEQPQARSAIATAADRLIADHFVIVELYGVNRQSLIERNRSGYDAVEAALDRSAHRFPKALQSVYHKHYVDGVIYLQVIAPITAGDGRTTAYFESVYQVDAATMADIRYQLLHALAIMLIALLATTVMLYPAIVSLNRDVLKFSRRLLHANLDMLEVLGSAIAKRDSDTDTHNYRVTWYAVRLAEAAGLSKDAIRQVIKGAFLHDVGKIGISDTILLKPGKLTAEEFAVMQQHVAIGVDIIRGSEWLDEAAAIVRHHHEKFGGGGYPDNLAGEAIPLSARIFAVVDVFDALTSRRPYKEPMPLARSMAILDEGEAKHFDPALLALFRDNAAAWLAETARLGHDGLRNALRSDIERYFFA